MSTRRKDRFKVKELNKVEGIGKGKSTRLFLGFQCLNHKCDEFIHIDTKKLKNDFSIVCPKCSHNHTNSGSNKFFDYEVRDHKKSKKGKLLTKGEFIINHSDHIQNAGLYKLCIRCHTMQSVNNFAEKSSNASGYQEYCTPCKNKYNSYKNFTRTPDQHRESSQKRRLYIDLAGSNKIDSENVYKRFGYKCFNQGAECIKDLSDPKSNRHLDHTLPAYYLWPLTTENATLLCDKCNGSKNNKWPSKFYSDKKLRSLSKITGIPYNDLAGEAFYNPEALKELQNTDKVDSIIDKYAKYMTELMKLRNRILKDTTIDFFKFSEKISQEWIKKADIFKT